jgi:RNA polymerase sigma-70 factor, ECF subfamily
MGMKRMTFTSTWLARSLQLLQSPQSPEASQASTSPMHSLWSMGVRGGEQEQAVESEGMAENASARFELLYRRYYPGILTFLCFLVGSREAAEDLASLTFEKALLHIHHVRLETAGPWLFRIARNCAIDYFRRARPTISLEELHLEEHPHTTSLEEAAIAGEEQRGLLAHLDRLSQREREIIGLKFVAGLHNREIARVLALPEGTVSSLLYRTLRRLRTSLNEDEDKHAGKNTTNPNPEEKGGHDEPRK